MPAPSIADRIGDFLPLDAGERSALVDLTERERPLRRGATLVRQNERSTDLFALKSGMMMGYVLLGDGSRQILRFLFPGDLLGTQTFAFGQAQQTFVAIVDSVVAPIERTQLAGAMLRHPRLALALAAMEQAEHVAIADRLAAVAKTSARARVAAVLLDLRERLRRADPAIVDTFAPGLTQEEIGDAVGLTAVHVNRMLRQLEEQRLISRSGGRVTILDDQGLRRAAERAERRTAIDLSWLPVPQRA
ncbi:CRP-like cAMP-binding protein [Sphingomonas sp. BE138]|uniref:Crp/Fnr family transcriptional regulator n=1 Tax=Sphingomonas sp. BE138 TaxID=2817845 RepID=UPI00285FE164|nr:Crp/Fnr family transcriptional regulator [Sphingomonas sp. BE138]MDR6788157.1 CRP-like cAMP-binding protein [Sphingomonas sp. BE138]